MQDFFIQIHYVHQDETVVDTAKFTVPDRVTQAAFASTVQEVTERYNASDDSFVWSDRTETMLDEVANLLCGQWDFVMIEGVVTVDDDGRRFEA